MIRRRTSVTLAVALVALGLHAQEAQPDRFRYERPVLTDGQGPRRLAIDVPILAGSEPLRSPGAGARPDVAPSPSWLSDFRLVDGNGRLVPYVLLHPPSREPVWIPGRVLPIADTEKTSGFEVDLLGSDTIDAIRVAGLAPPFLKRLILEGSGDREHWTMLAGEGTLFDLPDERLRQTDLAFSPGAFRYLRVTWNDRNSGRVPVPDAVFARRADALVAPPPLTATLVAERRPSEPGRSRYRVRLPAARLPVVALDLNARGGHVFRRAVVFESRLSGVEAQPAELGRTTLTRVVRDGVAAGDLRIPISPPREAAIDLVIDDGSNAPLELENITAVFAALPWIYFEAPAGPVVARYGNPTLTAPRYDLEAVRDTLNVAAVPPARWGEPRRLDAPAAAAPAAPMPQTGAVIDAGPFKYARAIPDGAAGLVALELDAAALTHSRGPDARFADVRIVDASSRQIPYILERRDEPLALNLTLTPRPAQAGGGLSRTRSTYVVTLPYENLRGSLVLETSARVFQRTVHVGIERPPDRTRRDRSFDVTAIASWTHADPDTAAPALALSVAGVPTSALILTVDEGDNSALPIVGVRLLLPTYRVRFYRPAAATLRLLYGRPDLSRPQYDLALLAPHVMGVEALEISAAPETGSSAAVVPFITPRTFWILLGAAVVVLLGLVVRLVRS